MTMSISGLSPVRLVLWASLLVFEHVEGKRSSVLERATFVIFSNEPSDARQRLTASALVEGDVQLHIIELDGGDLLEIPGYWTIFPVLTRIQHELANSTEWIVFVGEPPVTVNLKALQKLLTNVDPKKNILFGKGARDETPTVIHHYSSDHIPYPILKYGLIFSRTLFVRMDEECRRSPHAEPFSIDAGYELARFLKARLGVELSADDNHFCDEDVSTTDCAFQLNRQLARVEATDTVVEKIYVAIKTFHGYHHSRISVLRRTWLKDLDAPYEIFSDEEDASIGTIKTRTGNTERGHCGKTMEILLRFLAEKVHPWLLLVDDDTLVSFPRLQALTTSLDSKLALAVGQRYGFMVTGSGNDFKYNYLTGGAGILMSRPAVEAVIRIGCRCSKDDDPDDMVLGACMTAAGIRMLHRNGFHQARPSDYPDASLLPGEVITFHKFTGLSAVDRTPENIYQKWLAVSYEERVVLNDEL